MGAVAFLRPLHVCETRGWRHRPSLGACGRLWTSTKTKPQVQTLWEDQQDCHIPWLLPHFWVREWRNPWVPWDTYSGPSIRREEGCQGLIYSLQRCLHHTFKNLKIFKWKSWKRNASSSLLKFHFEHTHYTSITKCVRVLSRIISLNKNMKLCHILLHTK